MLLWHQGRGEAAYLRLVKIKTVQIRQLLRQLVLAGCGLRFTGRSLRESQWCFLELRKSNLDFKVNCIFVSAHSVLVIGNEFESNIEFFFGEVII